MAKLTYLEVVEETAKFYTDDPSRRSFISNENNIQKCQYNNVNGNKCALGRCCHKIDPVFEGDSAYDLLGREGYDIFLLQYRHLKSKDFWFKLQIFHDQKSFWGTNGLNGYGKDELFYLKEYAETLDSKL